MVTDVENPAQDYYHHELGNVFIKRGAHPERLVWITPPDTPHLHCLHAFLDSVQVVRSFPITVGPESTINKRESLADIADMEGP